jgi:hypothetical protein
MDCIKHYDVIIAKLKKGVLILDNTDEEIRVIIRFSDDLLTYRVQSREQEYTMPLYSVMKLLKSDWHLCDLDELILRE